MKVLLINNYLYRRGGAEVVFLNTAELLKSKGHTVVFFSQEWQENVKCDDKKYFPKGIDTKARGFIDRLKGVWNYFHNVEAAKKIDGLLRVEKPDIAHIHNFWGGISGSIFKVLKKHNIPIVHTVHDYRMICPGYAFKNGKDEVCEKCEGKKFYRCISNRCSKGSLLMSTLMCLEMYNRNCFNNPLKNIDSFMFVSNFCYDKHLQYAPKYKEKHCVTMYNSQDADVIAEANKTLDTFDSYYLFYGRLSYEKGIKTLISAFTDKKHLKLKIVGTGPLEKELKQFCIEKNATNIEFLGFKTGKELFNIIKNAKFVCVPSEWYENNPMTIIESYTLRTPVIGSEIGGIPEIIEDGVTGYKFKSGDVEDLKSTIDKAASLDKEEYAKMKENAENFGKENFGKDNYYTKLMELYKHTIKNYNKK
ncbi:MAG: glycosyltransferase [Bacteroidaceae bacterium]|nr:glycosyltransferase [Bacteroidaceae bacterium]